MVEVVIVEDGDRDHLAAIFPAAIVAAAAAAVAAVGGVSFPAPSFCTYFFIDGSVVASRPDRTHHPSR